MTARPVDLSFVDLLISKFIYWANQYDIQFTDSLLVWVERYLRVRISVIGTSDEKFFPGIKCLICWYFIKLQLEWQLTKRRLYMQSILKNLIYLACYRDTKNRIMDLRKSVYKWLQNDSTNFNSFKGIYAFKLSSLVLSSNRQTNKNYLR